VGYIPEGAEWYLADLVVEISVEAELRTVLHINTVLVHANDAEKAYEKALSFGKRSIGEPYRNSAGALVTMSFLGLRELAVIHEPLEDGAELFYEEHVGLTPEKTRQLILEKSQLSVFAPLQTKDVPDYASGQIQADFEAWRNGLES
jgi:hypothetical protein